MKLTKKDKLAVQRLLSAGQILSNVAFNLGQKLAVEDAANHDAEICRKQSKEWDGACAEARQAIRKLQLPPF